MLKSQHREVESLFAAFDTAEDSDEKQELFERIADALAAHTRIEEEIFYPEVFSEETEDELREAVEEHLAVKRIIADLLEMEPDDEQFVGKMHVVRDLVQHHVDDEEGELFPLLEGMDAELSRDMGARMLELYEQLIENEPRNEVPSQTEHAAQL